MPIRSLLDAEGAVFGPEDITAITAAYEIALKRLKVVDRRAAMALLVAKTTMQIAKEGKRDPEPERKGDPALSSRSEARAGLIGCST
jgi:hypothetical protein